MVTCRNLSDRYGGNVVLQAKVVIFYKDAGEEEDGLNRFLAKWAMEHPQWRIVGTTAYYVDRELGRHATVVYTFFYIDETPHSS